MDTGSITAEMANEARAMAQYALRAGIAVPAWALEVVSRGDTPGEEGAAAARSDLLRAHAELSKLVSPFTPDLVVLFELESKVTGFLRALGRTRLERSFMLTAIGSVLLFIGLSLSPYLKNPQHADIFNAVGLPLLVNELFFISAAAVGASFSGLFQIDRELSLGTFLPKNQSSYWVQLILGIVAGLLLSTILDIYSKPGADEGRVNLTQSTLALLGGFSSSVVQRIVQRLIEALEAILKGSAEQDLLVRDQENKQRLEESLAKERMRSTLMLVDMQRRLAGGERPEALQGLMGEASRAVLSNDPFSPLGGSPGTSPAEPPNPLPADERARPPRD